MLFGRSIDFSTGETHETAKARLRLPHAFTVFLAGWSTATGAALVLSFAGGDKPPAVQVLRGDPAIRRP